MKIRRWLALGFLAFFGVAAGAGTAGAQLEVELTIVEPDEEDEQKSAKEPPTFRAVVSGARKGLKEDDFVLQQLNPVVEVEAERVLGYADTDEQMTLVVLVQGNEDWMGNDTYADEDEQVLGAYQGVGPALDALNQMGPSKAQAALLAYSDSVETLQQLGPLSDLSASSLGPQNQFNEIGSSLEAGLEAAERILLEASGRKVLVIIGDGRGNDPGEIAERAKQLKAIGVEGFAIQHVVDTGLEAGTEGRNLEKVAGKKSVRVATSSSDFERHAKAIVDAVNARYYVDFPGSLEFAWGESEPVDFVVLVDSKESEAVGLALTWTPPASGGGSLWWLWLLLVLLLVGIIIIIIVVKKKKGAAEPAEMPMPPMEAPPPMAAQPQKTVMLSPGGTDDGTPIVGWIVPLTGPQQFQTFKLLQGATKVGTGGEAHIHVSDTFMSTEHAEIVCSPMGFVLKDGGSTNGTFVNQKRIDSHELVDNDVFTLGKTDFKFKSIN